MQTYCSLFWASNSLLKLPIPNYHLLSLWYFVCYLLHLTILLRLGRTITNCFPLLKCLMTPCTFLSLLMSPLLPVPLLLFENVKDISKIKKIYKNLHAQVMNELKNLQFYASYQLNKTYVVVIALGYSSEEVV